MTNSFELGPIRPPSEAASLLIRVTKNCSWNKCTFCRIYKDTEFQLRSVAEIKQDIATARIISDEITAFAGKSGTVSQLREAAVGMINNPLSPAHHNIALWRYAGGESAFLQDANTLIMRTGELAEVIGFLKETFPSLERVTSYCRSKTAAKKKLTELVELREAGLSRIHIGMESGYDPLLQYMSKGVTAAEHIRGGRNVVASGISLCEYVILGLGGQKWWREHALQTARVLNEISPAFIRIRTLTISRRMPLYQEIDNGNFIRATDEQIVEEERLLIENLECRVNYVSDHITNLLQEIQGELPRDKEKILACLDRFLALSPAEKVNFKLGRRLGIYTILDDLYDSPRRQMVEQLEYRLGQGNKQNDDKTIHTLMEGFI